MRAFSCRFSGAAQKKGQRREEAEKRFLVDPSSFEVWAARAVAASFHSSVLFAILLPHSHLRHLSPFRRPASSGSYRRFIFWRTASLFYTADPTTICSSSYRVCNRLSYNSHLTTWLSVSVPTHQRQQQHCIRKVLLTSATYSEQALTLSFILTSYSL